MCEVSVVPEECAPESKVARLDFRHWCNEDPEGKRFRLVARGAESFDEYDERRFSASHLEKRVIDNRPPVHLALDALEQEAPNRLMGSVLEFATREQRAVLKSALLGRVSLATMESLGALGMSVMEYRQMVLEFSRESMAG
ncbi:MAG: hypothetical protein RSG77_14920 [Hafnia sp.]